MTSKVFPAAAFLLVVLVILLGMVVPVEGDEFKYFIYLPLVGRSEVQVRPTPTPAPLMRLTPTPILP